MAAPTNTVVTLSAVGNREDLQDQVYRISPEKTPFTTNIGTATAKAVYHEYTTEDLDEPDATNIHLEGDDVTTFEKNTRAREGNYTSIFRKSVIVSGSQEAVDTAGVPSEYARQKLLKGIEARRDMEVRFLGNFGSGQESGSTPRAAAGVQAMLRSNTDWGAGGVAGSFASNTFTAATPGTARSFDESQVKDIMQAAFDSGAELTQLYMGSKHKREFSEFPGIAETRNAVKQSGNNTIVGAMDIYLSDFGDLRAIPVQRGLTDAVVAIDPQYFKVATLKGRGWGFQKLAKTGDNMKGFTLGEKTLCVTNEKAGAVIGALA